jgi:hypothetical protein
MPGRSKNKPHVQAERLSRAPDPMEQLRAELRRWSLCRTFVHQFSIIAQPAPAAAKASKPTRRKQGGAGDRGAWRPYAFSPRQKKKRALAKRRSERDTTHDSERAALAAYFGAMIEATRRSVPRRDVAAAVRALRDQQRAAMRALTDRQQKAKAAKRYARLVERAHHVESITNKAPLVA